MNPISNSRIQSNNLLIMVVSAVILALGVALCANYLTELIGTTKVLMCIGGTLITVSIFLISKLLNPKIKQVVRLRGGYFFEPETLKGKEVLGYAFNQDIATYLTALCTENKAYAKALLNGYEDYDAPNSSYDPDVLDYYNLVASCTEFLFLRKLGLHLNSYFVHEDIDRNKICTIPRSAMPQNVLKNRVLELITRNHREREAFLDHDGDSDFELCFAVGDSGEVFDRLNLELPLGTKLQRLPDNSLRISSDIFDIRFVVDCNATNTVISPALICGNYDAPWLVSVKLEVTVKKRLILNSNDIEMHQWLDSFLNSFENYISIKKLEERSYLQLVNILKP
ncbi:hypothetical protein ACLH0G_04620 [Aeromonas rivipollensis]|uniref:hypothetical protein n=1 Tax=Aeromonas rivipollensis TaxID=948519 RepID=UPI003CFE7CF0